MKVRWGVCGAGAICNDFCHALQSLPTEEHEIVAIASRSEGKAKTYAEKFSIPKAYSTYTEFAADTDIDIVYIATWTASHITLTKMMLNAGKHVLCETPMGYNADEVKEVFQLAKGKKLFLMEAFWSRAFEIYADIRKAIDQGDIGEVKMVTANLCFYYMDKLKGLEEGGGNIFELGIFNVQFVNWIFKNEKPEVLKVLAPIGKMIPDYFWCPEEAIFPTGKKSYPLTPKDPTVYNFPNSHDVQKELTMIRRCIVEGLIECPVMTYEDSLATHDIVDEALLQIGLKYDTDKIKKLSGAT